MRPTAQWFRQPLAAWVAGLLTFAGTNGARAQQKSTMVAPPPPITFGAYDSSKPANDFSNPDIPPDYFNVCQICSPAPARAVASCPTVVGTQYDCMNRCHVVPSTKLAYTADPPNSGFHFALPWRNMGESQEPVPRGRWVHSLEHGAVALLYNCPSGCNTQLASLRKVMRANTDQPVFLSADPDIGLGGGDAAFAAVAWSWTWTGSSVDEAAVDCFIKQHGKRGPECYQPGTDATGNAVNQCPTFCDINGQRCSRPTTDLPVTANAPPAAPSGQGQ